ncbi:Purine nucleoside phosphorylase [Smittium mucronatum]|uniref:Purine nucleoside phosphorylase n=1 Tax=Smittium mucronatum TaxID=133383 RepID=A0A1R0GYR3_9FUNG|nr:Purine nucleoside phosphorylase [Smittium mucronatum]
MFIDSEKYHTAADYLKSQVSTENLPDIAIISGSGLGGLASGLSGNTITIKYDVIPGFVKSTVHGHVGELVFGSLSGRKVVVMRGRFHCYEGYSVYDATFPVRVFGLLGVKTLIVTNAAGGLNQEYSVGDIMIISDHLSIPGISGKNALIGPNIDEFGTRFPSVSDVYTPRLRVLAAESYLRNPKLASNTKNSLREGVYGWVMGPSYETRAECRALLTLGCDAVGMSTVPEVVVAKHFGMEVLAFSLITNEAVISKEPSSIKIAQDRINGISSSQQKKEVFANHEEVMEVANERASDLMALVRDFVGML